MSLGKSLAPVLEHPLVYETLQRFDPFSSRLANRLLTEVVKVSPSSRLLDIGCGAGGRARLFSCSYTGIDINPRYAAFGRARGLDCQEMDCASLSFESDTFDAAFSLALYHHVPDDVLKRSVSEALRVLRPGGTFHIIDAVWSSEPFKQFFFSHDRGNHQREPDEFRSVVSAVAPIDHVRMVSGTMHDFVYMRLVKNSS